MVSLALLKTLLALLVVGLGAAVGAWARSRAQARNPYDPPAPVREMVRTEVARLLEQEAPRLSAEQLEDLRREVKVSMANLPTRQLREAVKAAGSPEALAASLLRSADQK